MENKKQLKQLPIYLKKTILEISEIIEEKEFILYGGMPIDYLYNKNKKFSDLDIAIKKTSKKDINNLKKILIKKGFDIIVPFREYTVCKNKKVYLIYAKKDQLMLDICFLSDYNLASGLFNLENLYCRFPELDIVDNSNSIEGIQNKKIIFIKNPTEENPYLLLSRFIYLCAKYEILFMDDHENKKILFKIKKELELIDDFESLDQFSSCLNSILKSIIKTNNRKYFLKNLIDSGILRKKMAILDKSFRLAVKNNDNSLNKIKNKKVFIFYLFDLLDNKKDKKIFLELISRLNFRKWDSNYNNLSNIKL